MQPGTLHSLWMLPHQRQVVMYVQASSEVAVEVHKISHTLLTKGRGWGMD